MGQKDSTSSDNEPKRFEKSAPLAEICKQSTHAVENAAQLSQLQAQCTEVTGSIVISEYIDPVVDLGKLQSIKGDLLVRDSPSVIEWMPRVCLLVVSTTPRKADWTLLETCRRPRRS